MSIIKNITFCYLFFIINCIYASIDQQINIETQAYHLTLIIKTLDFALIDIVKSYPNNTDKDFFYLSLDEAFEKFYYNIKRLNSKSKILVILLFLEYSQMLFKYGIVSTYIQEMNEENKINFYNNFIDIWIEIFNNEITPFIYNFENDFIPSIKV